MIPAKKKRVYWFFAAIFSIFIIVLVYLLFFNVGLSAEETQEGGRAVYVINDSSRLIRNITVSVAEGGAPVEIMKIAELSAGAREKITDYDFFSGAGEKEIIVSAPYHQPFVKRIVVSAVSAPEIDYEVMVPAVIYANAEFSASLKVCNRSRSALGLGISGDFDAEVFGSAAGAGKNVTIAADACENIGYSLRAGKAGKTTIYFNIKGVNITKQIERELEVLE